MSNKDHKLAAIVFTDIVGYTKRMEENEQLTMQLLQKQREIIFPIVESYGGEIIKEIGDGLLMMFESAIEAVRCAVSIQTRLKDEELTIRAGIHIGDVIFKGGDVFGSAVNTAARIEPLAPPNGVCVSETVRKQLENKDDIITISLGKKELKGVGVPVEIFQVFIEGVTTKQKKTPGFILKDLWRRHVIQILLGYLLAAWIIKQAVAAITTRYMLSPHLVDLTWVILLSLIPTVFLLAYYHGKRSSGKWTKVEMIGFPVNAVLAIVLIVIVFRGKDLGATTETKIVKDEEGKIYETIIPKREYRKKLLIYFFDNESGDTALNWIQYAVPLLVDYDLSQNIFLQAQSAFNHVNSFKDAGYNDGTDIPFMLQKKIASKYDISHFVTGSFKLVGESYQLTTRIYETKSGDLISELTIDDADYYSSIDKISENIFSTLNIPNKQLNIQDLPLSEIFSSSVIAAEYFTKSNIEIHFNNNWEKAIHYSELALKEDPSFAIANSELALYYFNNNMPDKAEVSLQKTMDNIYKLPERKQFFIKFIYYTLKQQADKAMSVLQMLVELYPDDIEAHELLAQRYQFKNMIEEAIAEYKIINTLDPNQTKYLRYIGALYEHLGNFDSALFYHTKYMKLEPKDHRSYRNLSKMYLTTGDFDQASINIDKALAIEPNEVDLSLSRMEISIRQGEFENLEEQYLDLLQFCGTPSDSGEVYKALSDYCELLGQAQKSLEYHNLFTDCVGKFINPMNYNVYKLFSISKVILAGKVEEAFQIIKTVEEKLQPPVDKVVAFGYMFYYIDTDRPDEAASYINDARELAIGFGEEMLLNTVYFAEGRIDMLNEDYDSAIVCFDNYLEKSPTSYEMYYYKAECCRKQNNLKDAKKNIDIVLKHKPTHPKANYEAAMIYEADDDNEKALFYLQKALNVWKDADPDYKPAIKARAKLLEVESV